MNPCDHAKFCGKRMAVGDRANGCNSVDQMTCSPELSLHERTPTAPAGPNGYRPIWMRVLDEEKPR